ncbi:tautomerase family protein [Pseudonocardia kujensis]|uniref:tautomerase family protein n=1 Tax=Pseudonocardia kujensis TaxID=1128675 RepID=UPI001E57E376|nr:tautomerase family protein [Pseudonocardia kujensis]MCE0765124.1 tautomerase family protein [Pseudonocardia kujensis]
MPILTLHLVDGRHRPDDIRALVAACAATYAHELDSPMDRVRVFVRFHDPALTFVAGAFVDDVEASLEDPTDLTAPFFEFIVLKGRPLAQRQNLLAAFTDLVVSHLGVRRELVRGRAIEVDPQDWGIGGVPAFTTRASEIAARAAAGTPQ